MLDVVILNRNLGNVADELVTSLVNFNIPTSNVVVVDSGSDSDKVSEFTTVRVMSPEIMESGLRVSKGFNLGLSEILNRKSQSDWIMLLPVDSVIQELNFLQVQPLVNRFPKIQVVVPKSSSEKFESRQAPNKIVWYFDEGPLIIRRDFVIKLSRSFGIDLFFDSGNYRGMYNAAELAFKAYINSYAVLASDHIKISEDSSFQISQSELVKTENVSVNSRLLLEEGKEWLRSKYGILDPISLNLVNKLLWRDFLQAFPEYETLISL